MTDSPQAGATWRTEEVAVLYTDIRDSVALTGRLGEERAQQAIDEHFAILFPIISHWKGRVLKTLGDGLLAVFPDSVSCLHAATQCQQEMRRWNAGRSREEQIRIRIAGHFGPALVGPGDVGGDVPNVAERLLEWALADEVVVSGPFHDRVPTDLPYTIRPLGSHTLPGRGEPIAIFDVQWESDALTVQPEQRIPRPLETVRLVLVFAGREIVHPGPGRRLVVGRTDDSDLAIPNLSVSRNHCEIVHQGGQYVLRDTSLNGTDVELENRVAHLGRGETVALRGEGRIHLGGRDVATVEFRVVTGA
jgi:class 3 adenylate cyclase